jgi:formylglycine-generating enzyme required for sulfatase activity
MKRPLLLALMLTCSLAALPAQEQNLVIELGDGVEMEFVLIPAGSFMMGEGKPIHKVTITKPFYIGKYEVTQEQWKALMGNSQSRFFGLKNPVERVSWYDCQDFISKLKSKTRGLLPRLPTEAEWEYACRAGSQSAYCFGDSEADLDQYAWYGEGTAGATHPVGAKRPNAWGLYDMHGNVSEWCFDFYDESYYERSPETDPRGPDSGEKRVRRGGDYLNESYWCRSASRIYGEPENNWVWGFRLVLELEQ